MIITIFQRLPNKLTWPVPGNRAAAGRIEQKLSADGVSIECHREEGVLIMASGMSDHNLQVMRSGVQGAELGGFDAWLTKAVQSEGLIRDIQLWSCRRAPFARFCHPREEHLVPLFVASGAAGDDVGRCIFTDRVVGGETSAYRFG